MVRYKGHEISRQDILTAMAEFDQLYPNTNDYDNWLEKDNYKYAVAHGGRLYPPKHIIGVVTGLACTEHSGGWGGANAPFRKLGFEVKDKSGVP